MEGHEISRLFTLVDKEAKRRFPYGCIGSYEGVSATVLGIRIVYSDHGTTCKTPVLITWDEVLRLLENQKPVTEVVREKILLDAAE